MNPTSTKPKSTTSTTATTTTTTAVASSYDVFNAVDSLVSKPVYGSDGASRWQEFNANAKANTTVSSNTIKHKDNAPKAPLKAIDRLNGFTSWNDERQNEQSLRSETMNGTTISVGYTNFKLKNNNTNNEKKPSSSLIASVESVSNSSNNNNNNNNNKRKIQKQQKQQTSDDHDNNDTKIQSSLVADNFIPSKKYIGTKVGYVFTTRQPSGTGYYLDTKAIVQQKQQGGTSSTSSPNNNDSTTLLTSTADNIDVKRTKKKQKQQLPVIINDPMNPLEQIAAAIERKNLLLQKQQQYQYQYQHQQQYQQILPKQQQQQQQQNDDDPNKDLPIGWFSTIDPNTKQTYYYNPTTSERSWNKPKTTNSTISQSSNSTTPVVTVPETSSPQQPTTDTATATTSATATTGATQREEKTEANGWYCTTDPVTNKFYWYNIYTKETIWR